MNAIAAHPPKLTDVRGAHYQAAGFREGLYLIEFETPTNTGADHIVVHDGHLWGGSPVKFYSGTYEVADERFSAVVETGRHTKDAISSSFGAEKLTINVVGTIRNGTVLMAGSSPQAPDFYLRAKGRFLCE